MTRNDPVVMTGLAFLVTGGIFLAYPWTLAIAALAGFIWFAFWFGNGYAMDRADAHAAHAKQARELANRADQQHNQVMQGDPAGVYGDYPPVRTTTE